MADLLQEYGDGIRSGTQELVSLNKHQMKSILEVIQTDVGAAYQASSDNGCDKILMRAQGRLAALITILSE